VIETLTASPDATTLNIAWEAGTHSALPAAFLRQNAQDAWSKRERFDHGEVRVAPGIGITGVYPVGRYGVNVHFSDGHEKAIYPFVFLRELSEKFDN